jgi:hypothetical protein
VVAKKRGGVGVWVRVVNDGGGGSLALSRAIDISTCAGRSGQLLVVIVVVVMVVGDQSTSLRIDDNRSSPKARTYRTWAARGDVDPRASSIESQKQEGSPKAAPERIESVVMLEPLRSFTSHITSQGSKGHVSTLPSSPTVPELSTMKREPLLQPATRQDPDNQ